MYVCVYICIYVVCMYVCMHICIISFICVDKITFEQAHNFPFFQILTSLNMIMM